MRPRPNRQSVIATSSVPAPIGGLNARDSIAAMPPTDAVVMVNWFPTPTTLDVRNGSQAWATGISGNVETLFVYNGLATTKLFAVAGTTFYDCTAQGPATVSPTVGVLSSRWSYTNFGTPGGQFIVAVDAVGQGQIYNGTTWTRWNDGADLVIASITNAGTTATLTTTVPHNLNTGAQITVSGATPAPYNGTYIITVTGPSTFTYVMLSNPGGNATVVGTLLYGYPTTGVPTNQLAFVTAFKGRLYFIQQSTLKVWYLPPASVGGTMTAFDMSSVFKLGGHLVAMQSWNIDTVQGPNDYFAFFSSTGEVVVYNGFDPSQSSTWNLVGNFRIGRPAFGNRFFTKVGSDIYAATVDGLVPLSKAMLTDRSQGDYQVSAKVDNLIQADVGTYSNNFGWQSFLHPPGNKFILNVPSVTDSVSYQYVCNTITGAWTTFQSWNAFVFDLFGDRLMYGTQGQVIWADTGYTDLGNAITTDLKPAFSSFGLPAQNKQYTMVRPIFSESAAPGIAATLNVDYRDAQPAQSLTLPPQANVSLWNISPWNTSMWSNPGTVNINWQSVAGIGYVASYRMRTITKAQCSLLGIDYGYQSGGIY